MVHRPLYCRIVRDHVHGQPRTLCERPELVVDRLDLDRVERDERRLPRALVAHVFNAVDRRLLLVYDDRVDVPPEDYRHGRLVLALCRLAEVNDAPAHPGEDTLEVGERFFEARFALRLLLVDTSLRELLVDVDKLLVGLLL